MDEGPTLIRELDRCVFGWTKEGMRRRVMGIVTPQEFDSRAGETGYDCTAAVQAAIDEAARSGLRTKAYLPAGDYHVSQIRYYPGMWIDGVGTHSASGGYNGSLITQIDGVDDDCVIIDPNAIPTTEYCHSFILSNVRIQKKAGSADTVGSGFSCDRFTGENFIVRNVFVADFPEDGVLFKRGGVPLYVENIHAFRNGRYGVSFQRTGAELYQNVTANLISGDNNGVALIGIGDAAAPLGGSLESFLFAGIKSETNDAGKQLDTVVLNNTNAVMITLLNPSFSGIGVTGNAIVRNVNSNCLLAIVGPRVQNVNFLLDDVFSGRTFADMSQGMFYYSSSTLSRFVEIGLNGLKVAAVPTTELPAAGAVRDGKVVVEDDAVNGRNLIYYVNGQRFRVSGAAF